MQRIQRMGWRPDLPDFRDYSVNNPKLPKGFAAQMTAPLVAAGLRVELDLRPGIARITDQGPLGSCVGHGIIALHEYCDKKAYGRFTPLSRLFLYKAMRNWIGVRGDTGAEIRNGMGALALFGAPPEEHYPYNINAYDDEPSPFIYQLASNFKGTQYARLDTQGLTGDALVEELKGILLKGWPFVFGFTCYESLDYIGPDGRIAFPGPKEHVTGGHCVAAFAANDRVQCPNSDPGSFGILNSWGSWGEGGFGWIPYDYFRQGLARDCWALTKADWVDTEQF